MVSEGSLRAKLRAVKDPELPILDVVELGIVREVEPQPEGGVRVRITPTWSGCPALETIEREIVAVLEAEGHAPVEVETVLAPAWTSDWITPEAREKLRAYGIAPPARCGSREARVGIARCPRCDGETSDRRSEYGATACKALWWCAACREPFETLKTI